MHVQSNKILCYYNYGSYVQHLQYTVTDDEKDVQGYIQEEDVDAVCK